MKIQFLAEENLRRAIVLGLRRREPAADFVQAYEAGAAGKDDLTVLQIAAEQNRILVSHDLKTIPRHFRHFIARQTSPGAILIPQKLTLSTAIEQLVLIWLVWEAEEWVSQIRFLPLERSSGGPICHTSLVTVFDPARQSSIENYLHAHMTVMDRNPEAVEKVFMNKS